MGQKEVPISSTTSVGDGHTRMQGALLGSGLSGERISLADFHRLAGRYDGVHYESYLQELLARAEVESNQVVRGLER